MKIIGVDPGVSTFAAVLYEPLQGFTFRHVHTTKPRSGPLFDGIIWRAKDQAEKFLWWLVLLPGYRTGAVFQLAIENYRDFGGGYKRQVKNRWQTPLVLGLLAGTLPPAIEIMYQDPTAVLKDTQEYREAWRRHTRLIAGDELLTNEHLRDAACHALWAAGRVRSQSETTT